MLWIRQYKPQPHHKALYNRALIITISGNVLLAAAKGLVAYLSGSVAIYADAANSISDVFYSMMMIAGLWLALRPPDISHPQGHSRFEPLVGLVVTFSMAFAGYEAGRASLTRFLSGGEAIENGLPTLILLASAAVKAGMFYFISRIARQLQSPTLATTAKDNLSDVLTSAAAFIGVIGSKYIHPLLDPIAGLAVAVWIFRAAFMAGRENLGFLTGAGASEELRRRIVAAAESVPGVLRVHHTMTEYVGPRLVVDLHVNVNGGKTLIETHAICDRITEMLEEFAEIDRAYVHIEPDDWV
jgi:cation diffusion facilitator family transporter